MFSRRLKNQFPKTNLYTWQSYMRSTLRRNSPGSWTTFLSKFLTLWCVLLCCLDQQAQETVDETAPRMLLRPVFPHEICYRDFFGNQKTLTSWSFSVIFFRIVPWSDGFPDHIEPTSTFTRIILLLDVSQMSLVCFFQFLWCHEHVIF